MSFLLAQLPYVSVETVLAVFSASMTTYFWIVKARRERANLDFFQIRDFRASLRRVPESDGGGRRLGLCPIQSAAVLAANNSTRQTSIVRFDCFLSSGKKTIKGHWGYLEDDEPPWNIGPESSIALAMCCYFDVDDDFEVPDTLSFRVEFITASGKRFPETFCLKAPRA